MGWWMAFLVLVVLRVHRVVGWSWWWVVAPLLAQTVFVGAMHALGFGGPLGPWIALLQLLPGPVAWALVFNLGGRPIPVSERPARRPLEKLGVAVSVLVHLFLVFTFFVGLFDMLARPEAIAAGDPWVMGITMLVILGIFRALVVGIRSVYRRLNPAAAPVR